MYLVTVLGLRCYGRLFLGVVSRGYSLLQGLSWRWLLLVWNTGSRCPGFGSCHMQAQKLWRLGLAAAQHVGSSRTEPVFPALVGRLLSTAPPGKSQNADVNIPYDKLPQ